jgi:DNA-binding LytR/AlgR family response regulator
MEIAVCDDNKLFLLEIEEQLSMLPMVDNIHKFSSLETFLLSIEDGKRYYAVLMDIEWENKVAGMDAAAQVYKLCPEMKVIFVTGRVERYSQQIFLHRTKLSGYLTKPINTDLLRANLQKVADALFLQEHPALILRKKGTPVSIPLRDILYIESQGHNILVHTAGETITAYERLANVMRSLPAGFYQCHKSFIVNMNQIRRFQSVDTLLKNVTVQLESTYMESSGRDKVYNGGD